MRRLVLCLLASGCALTGCALSPAAPAPTPAAHWPPPQPPLPGIETGIAGSVHDRNTRAPLPALVILLGNGQVRETQTDAAGVYAFANLPPAVYTVQVLSGNADVSKVVTLPEGGRVAARFNVDPDIHVQLCRFPIANNHPQRSMFSDSAQEAHLLGRPMTTRY